MQRLIKCCFLINIFICLFLTDVNAQISINNIKNHAWFLAGDSLQGRGTGTAGERIAAEYIARQLSDIGIEKIESLNSYFQQIPMHGSVPKPSSKLLLALPGDNRILRLQRDYLLINTGAVTFIPAPLPLVFVGYGIIAPEYDYNDYQQIDAEGKIVVFLDGEPHSKSPDYFDGNRMTLHSNPEVKQRIAISRGARGSIMIPINAGKTWAGWIKEFSFEDITLAYNVSAHLSLLINPQTARQLFSGAVYSLNKVIELHQQGSVFSFPLTAKISFQGEFEERDFITRNVLGVLPGSDLYLKDEYIIVSAHYDHLGIGPGVENDSVYNGLVDNALGVASLIEIARILLQKDISLKRSVLFFFPTAEEKGLLGSIFYTDNPAVPLYKTVININVDGVPVFDTFADIFAIGGQYSDIKKHIRPVFEKNNVMISALPPDIDFNLNTINRSDHFAFAKSGIPFLLVLEGMEYKNLPSEDAYQKKADWDRQIYHSPFDDINQPLNFDAVSLYNRLIIESIIKFANSPETPQWYSGTPFITSRLRSIAEKR